MSWRNRLRPAFFRGVPFHVDETSLAGGRRVAPHEYPKRDVGYTEDMGKRMRGYRVRAYLIGRDFDIAARLLIAALETPGPSILVLPLIGEDNVVCGSFTYNESKDQGGFASLDLEFVPAGTPAGAAALSDTASALDSAADAAKRAVAGSAMPGAASGMAGINLP